MKNKKFRVIFDGFETEEEAIAFAEWYEGDGEQHSGDWMSETTKVVDVTVDLKKYEKIGGFFANKNKEIIVPIEIQYTDEENEEDEE